MSMLMLLGHKSNEDLLLWYLQPDSHLSSFKPRDSMFSFSSTYRKKRFTARFLSQTKNSAVVGKERSKLEKWQQTENRFSHLSCFADPKGIVIKAELCCTTLTPFYSNVPLSLHNSRVMHKPFWAMFSIVFVPQICDIYSRCAFLFPALMSACWSWPSFYLQYNAL